MRSFMPLGLLVGARTGCFQLQTLAQETIDLERFYSRSAAEGCSRNFPLRSRPVVMGSSNLSSTVAESLPDGA